MQYCLASAARSAGLLLQARLAPLYEARLLAEVQDIAASIPPNELAIQWDTAVEFAMLEGVWPTPFGTPEQSLEPIVDMLVRIGDATPREQEAARAVRLLRGADHDK